jgi:hypothetical protein
MLKSIQASVNLCPMRLKIAVGYDLCGNGLVIWIGKICFGLNFARSVEIGPGSPEDIAVQLAEGWILGYSPTVRDR